jgi:hypothetical protein
MSEPTPAGPTSRQSERALGSASKSGQGERAAFRLRRGACGNRRLRRVTP